MKRKVVLKKVFRIFVSVALTIVLWGYIFPNRTMSLWLAVFIAATDVLVLIAGFFCLNFQSVKKLAKEFGWEVNKFWIGTTLPTSLAILILLLRLFSNSLGVEGFIVMTVVPFVWMVVLFQDGVHHEYDDFKILDGIKWFFFGLSVISIYCNDMGLLC